MAIQRDGGRMAQTRQAFTLQITLALFEAIVGHDDGRGINDDHARVAVDDDPIVLLDQLAGSARTHHSRNVQTASHDGGVRRLAAHIGHKTGEDTLLELQHVGG